MPQQVTKEIKVPSKDKKEKNKEEQKLSTVKDPNIELVFTYFIHKLIMNTFNIFVLL